MVWSMKKRNFFRYWVAKDHKRSLHFPINQNFDTGITALRKLHNYNRLEHVVWRIFFFSFSCISTIRMSSAARQPLSFELSKLNVCNSSYMAVDVHREEFLHIIIAMWLLFISEISLAFGIVGDTLIIGYRDASHYMRKNP